MAISVEIVQEQATSKEPAKVIIRENGKILYEIMAIIEQKQGADGGQYNCVTLEVRP